ncbi:MAG: DsbC family protein, partial [Aquabacterium sp.]
MTRPMPMLITTYRTLRGLLGLTLALSALGVLADEVVIRKVLAERIPNLPKIDEVTKSPLPGLWEVRMGTDIIYTDAAAAIVVQGSLIDTRTRSNLTEARIDKLMAIDFASLPLKDAVLIKQGNGSRRIAVFGDPNCGYCKRLEADLAKLKDVSIYTFVYPILGPESTRLSRDLWCAKDAAKGWRDWMLSSKEPARAGASCNTEAIERNVE